MAQQTSPTEGVETRPSDRDLDLVGRLATVRDSVAKVAIHCDRRPEDVQLVAVSKTQPESAVRTLVEAGHRVFGENRVQEAIPKWSALRAEHKIELRLIGHLQTNKVRDAVGFFDVIETLDRPSLAEALAHQAQRRGASPRLLIQVNTGDEPQKSGVATSEADAFIERCLRIYELPVVGLMCIPPLGQQASPHFALLARTAARHGLSVLSMGMSADYPLAIQLGATYVRIGTAIFGERAPVSG
ncbi:MAG TPA: YggS family pyridoxal phosphate-dependent enzyme [Beijerinckiaceae bacterium]|jgi:pyridoxal phosphate enzyme (YggS family)